MSTHLADVIPIRDRKGSQRDEATDTGYASVCGQRPALIPPTGSPGPDGKPVGTYRLRFVEHETKLIFKRRKLYCWFEVMDFGEHFGVRIPRYYGILRFIPDRKYGKNGNFGVGWKSDFLREYARLLGAPQRSDRFNMSALKKLIVVGRVRTVSESRDQKDIPEYGQYSVIDELLSVEEGRGEG